MIITKTPEEIEYIRESALLVSQTLGMLASELHPGITTKKLDTWAEAYIRDHGAKPGFLGLYGCPSTILTSVNEAVVHGLPNETPLQEGDIVAIDCGVLKNEFYGDHAYTFAIGTIPEETKKLLDVTKASLYKGIAEFRNGKRVGDIGYAIQQHTEKEGYGVVTDLVGHGLGKKLHEAPQIPNYGRRGNGKKFKEGMVVAIEPMINMGTHRVDQLDDGWTIVTADGKPSAHFEHNIAMVDGKPEILSTFKYIYKALQIGPDAEEDKYRKTTLVI